MEEGAKSLMKDVKALPAAVKQQGVRWAGALSLSAPPGSALLSHQRVPPAADCFKGLDLLVKNYLATVPLIGDLRSPAMRPRHWQALQEATKVRLAGVELCQAMHHLVAFC